MYSVFTDTLLNTSIDLLTDQLIDSRELNAFPISIDFLFSGLDENLKYCSIHIATYFFINKFRFV